MVVTGAGRSRPRHSSSVESAATQLTGTFASCVGDYRAETAPADDHEARLSAARYAARRCLALAGISAEQLVAVGVASPGVVSREGTVLFSPLEDWAGQNLSTALAPDFPCPVITENDCNLAALADRWRGSVQGSDDVAYILSGLRTGAGLVLGGRLHRGFAGAAGETGALPHLGWARTQDPLLA